MAKKIETADCVDFIVKYLRDVAPDQAKSVDELNPKHWKRLSKKKDGHIITRVFQNRKTETLYEVWGTDDIIVNLHAMTGKTGVDPSSDMTEGLMDELRRLVKQFIKDECDGDASCVAHSICSYIADKTTGWPDVTYEGDTEPLDCENAEIIHIPTKPGETLVLCCGGDWQEPLRVHIGYDCKKGLVAVKTEEPGDEDFHSNTSDEDLLNALFSTTDVNSILSNS